MKVGIVGLGLIGGSMAKAYHRAGAEVYACEIDAAVLGFARLAGVVSAELNDAALPELDLLLLCAYPEASEEWLTANAAKIAKDTLVMDCLGTKRGICALAFPLAERYGFTFVGGHPMAGTHNSGYKYSRETMFKGAPMVLVPPQGFDMPLLERIKELLKPAEFGSLTVTTAEQHDSMIAFTSQLAHVVSNAYIKSPTAGRHRGFSAGSYKDLTRVAWLSPEMWTELFLENGDNLLFELDGLIGELTKYRDALKERDAAEMKRLLAEGAARKMEIDGR